eukprot:scaffold307781_cov30-Tisochrysis_lutea.AAC.1
MAAMVCCSCVLRAGARELSRVHLVGRVVRARTLRRRRRVHGHIAPTGGHDGQRGGSRRALHAPATF